MLVFRSYGVGHNKNDRCQLHNGFSKYYLGQISFIEKFLGQYSNEESMHKAIIFQVLSFKIAGIFYTWETYTVGNISLWVTLVGNLTF
jgi:hypothetical protein